jgi:hypothetical protein
MTPHVCRHTGTPPTTQSLVCLSLLQASTQLEAAAPLSQGRGGGQGARSGAQGGEAVHVAAPLLMVLCSLCLAHAHQGVTAQPKPGDKKQKKSEVGLGPTRQPECLRETSSTARIYSAARNSRELNIREKESCIIYFLPLLNLIVTTELVICI